MAAASDRRQHDRPVADHPRPWEPRIRAIGVLLLAAFVVAALANVFGQKTAVSAAEARSADLEIEAPSATRSGLVYEAQFTFTAHRALERPALVLDAGWFDGLTVNTIDPEPNDWSQRDGRNVLVYDAVPAGDALRVRLEYQVNPTTAGRRDQGAALEDGGAELVSLEHAMTVFP